MNPYGYPNNGYPYGYPPPGAPIYPTTTTTYITPVGVPPVMAPPMVPTTTVTYGVPPPVMAPPMMVQPGYPVGYGVPPPNPYNYPTGPQIPGINGYSNRSISGHKFRSGFKVRHENRYPF
ncbi:hypothetical protein DICPUDRAFT_83449 [Dictyostelium purpureum]|uniref:Uncharacterized protein n=1 Tax=Dictyostelium purpureum TaxID=5786 RepID=F0ZZL3_DICPU|nr:uncharacterized protein DICPUDRAFT_83449 [Dictyostelium purpureum]EGC30622.1 hypothetical protein DICPUDRAFT_83449 [Dictyostelium purpureum]|eukprot:XP_003292857.1 hypothetical protein DICPUDRAFT_83449 [Dictyostelium purpureum]